MAIKLKTIEPDMIIHCKTQEEADLLNDHVNTTLYENFSMNGYWPVFMKQTCYHLYPQNSEVKWLFNSYADYKYAGNVIIEFEDLIIKDNEEDEPMAEKNMSSREEMIQRIKDCGQYIMDNAESILGDGKCIRELYCTCNFFDRSEPPYVTITKDVVPDSFIERFK